MLKQPPMKPEHIEARLQWAMDHKSWTQEWQTVFLSDKKVEYLMGQTDGHNIGMISERSQIYFIVACKEEVQ